MQIIPAIGLKNNNCVRLSRGEDDSSIVFNNNPEKQAIYFESIGCSKIHIVDLDAAFGRPEINFDSIRKIRKAVSIPIQLGGGIRSKDDFKRYFEMGIDNLIIGSLAVKKPLEVIKLSEIYKQKIYVSLDIFENNVMVKGWKENSSMTADEVLDTYKNSHINGFVVTDIKNDGMLKGIDITFLKSIINKLEKFDKKIIFAGGLTNYADLKNIKKIKSNKLEGIISGKSFYSGNIDLEKAQKILNNYA